MTRRYLLLLVAAVLLVLFALAGGCGLDECDELQEICNRCKDKKIKDQCEDQVRLRSRRACEVAKITYSTYCP